MRFLLERWIQKGIWQQLLLMALLVVLVALAGGVAAWALTSAFAGPGEAVWWAFLRLTDPGYLGDDEGLVLRSISTVVTILGYVLFMGSLIAILTQWLSHTLRRLESGLTPIRMRGHVAILGWTNRTPEIVLQLLTARGRLQRFLEHHGVHAMRVVVLSDEVSAERRHELRDHLREKWDEGRVLLRSGSSIDPDHLRRLDLTRASTVIVPGADFDLGGAEASDTRVIKTLLSVNGLLRRSDNPAPQVVGEVFDPLKQSLAARTMATPIEVIASDGIISRLVSQSIRHRGLAKVLLSILSHRQGNSLYLRRLPKLAGQRPRDVITRFPRAIVIGYLRGTGAERVTDLDPRTDEVLRADDQVVLLADKFDDCLPLSERDGSGSEATTAPLLSERSSELAERRILVLGWSHKIGALAVELGQSVSERFDLTVMSRVEPAERERWLRRIDVDAERVRIRHVEGDYSLEKDLGAVEPRTFDNVVFLASDWMGSSQEADARTVLGYILLRSQLQGVEQPPELLLELLDPANARLFDEEEDVYLVTPRVLSYLLAHVALRPELSAVFDALFSSGGFDIDLRSAEELGLASHPTTFLGVQRAAQQAGVLALGLLTPSGGVELNPDRARQWKLDASAMVVVMAAS